MIVPLDFLDVSRGRLRLFGGLGVSSCIDEAEEDTDRIGDAGSTVIEAISEDVSGFSAAPPGPPCSTVVISRSIVAVLTQVSADVDIRVMGRGKGEEAALLSSTREKNCV